MVALRCQLVWVEKHLLSNQSSVPPGVSVRVFPESDHEDSDVTDGVISC